MSDPAIAVTDRRGSLGALPPPAVPPTAVPPTAVPRRRWTVLIIGVALLVIVLVLVALTTGSSSGAALDPRSATPGGARAVAELLRAHDVAVSRGTTTGAYRTVMVPFPSEVGRAQLSDLLASGADVVLVDPGPISDVGLQPTDGLSVRNRAAGCSFGPASIAGTARMGGTGYAAPRATSCYDGALLVIPGDVTGGGRLVVLGSADFLTNKRLGEQGNAALALGLLSARSSLTWFSARPVHADQTLTDLLPDGVLWAVLQLAIAVLAVAAWRGRRLGPVVTEPLPVVVRAAETVLGRARLYAAARARGTAAEALRSGARTRLATLTHLDVRAAPPALIAAVAARTGSDPARVATLLYASGGYGAAESDAALVRLADELDALQRQAKEMARR